MKSNNKAIFHIIVTQLGWGLFLALNARRPLALIGQAVSEKKMFEYYDNIHVYCPGVGADEPLVPNFFQNH